MRHRYVKRPYTDEQSIEYLMGKGFSRNIAETLSARGINQDNFELFINDETVFHSPFEMANMQSAVETINYVIECGGSILIYGDYDADGLTASSILSLFFTDNGIDNDVIIPTRQEGYGLHSENVIKAFEKKFYDLVITVDCGISNAVEVEKIVSELGVEVIVTDHHELPEVLPDCICINPKLGYPFPNLAGAGVAWKLVEALAGRETALKYVDLACVGTIVDIMPLQDENRSIVKYGLANWNHKSLQKLAELSNCSKPVSSYDISMKLGPKINAAGRVGYPLEALKVLLSRDKVDMSQINRLFELNDIRVQMFNEIIAQAEDMCDAQTVLRERMVFVYSDNWSHGLLGIVAARLKEKHGVPALVMTLDGDCYVGSARGIDTLDLFEAVSRCKDHLAKYGGHKASLGFSVAKDKIDDFRSALTHVLGELDKSCFEKKFYYDLELGKDCNVSEVMSLSRKLQPLLPQDKIICRVTDSVKFANTFGKEDAHLSAILSSGLEIKGFKYGAYAPFIRNGANVDLLCSLEIDSFSQNICGIVEDLTLCNSVCFDEFYRLNLLKNFVACSHKLTDEQSIKSILCQDNTAVVFDDYETYLSYCEQYDLTNYYVDVFFDNSVSSQTVVISPIEGYSFDKYFNVVCFCRSSMARSMPNGAHYVNVQPANVNLYSLELSRDTCLLAYSALKRKEKFDSIKGVYDKYLVSKITYAQYIVALRVFEELQLIKIIDKYKVEFDTSVKKDLATSSIFNAFQR